MDIAQTRSRRAAGGGRGGEMIEFRGLIALTFAIFLVIEIVSRLISRLMPRRPDAAARGSVFAEARAAAYRTVPLAFMG